MSYERVSFRDIPIPIAKKYIEEYIEMLRKLGLEEGSVAQSMLEYVSQFTKCDPDKAEELYEKLVKDLGFREITASMIINIVPTAIDELRTLLQFEPSVPEEDVLQKVLDLLEEYCSSSES